VVNRTAPLWRFLTTRCGDPGHSQDVPVSLQPVAWVFPPLTGCYLWWNYSRGLCKSVPSLRFIVARSLFPFRTNVFFLCDPCGKNFLYGPFPCSQRELAKDECLAETKMRVSRTLDALECHQQALKRHQQALKRHQQDEFAHTQQVKVAQQPLPAGRGHRVSFQ
jgi:hypothetical protein